MIQFIIRNDKLENDTKQIDQEMTLFAITWTNEVNELKRNYSNDILISMSGQSREHFSAIISYLLMVIELNLIYFNFIYNSFL